MPDIFGSRSWNLSSKSSQNTRPFSSRRGAAGDKDRRLSPHERRELFGDVEIDRALYPSPSRLSSPPPSAPAPPPRAGNTVRPLSASALRLRPRLRPLLPPPHHRPTTAVPCSATSPPSPPLQPPPPPSPPPSQRSVAAAAAAVALPSRQQLCARLPSPPRGLWHRVWGLLGPRAERWATPAGGATGTRLGTEQPLGDYSGVLAPESEYFRRLTPEEYAETPFTYSERREFSDPLTGTRAVGMVVEGVGDRPTHVHVTFSDSLVGLPSHSNDEQLADSSKSTYFIMDPKFYPKDQTCRSNMLSSSCSSLDTQPEEELTEESGSVTNILRPPLAQGPHQWSEFVADLDQEERLREYDMEEVEDNYGWFC